MCVHLLRVCDAYGFYLMMGRLLFGPAAVLLLDNHDT